MLPRQTLGSRCARTGHVASSTGTSSHVDEFRKAVARHEMPYLSIHGLRHSWATLALPAGVHPKIVQERLGHSTILITLDPYSHVNPAMDADAANTVAALIGSHSSAPAAEGEQGPAVASIRPST